MFGGLAFAIYPICIALTNDRLTREEIQQSASSLLPLNGVGAAIGPALAGVLMSHLGPRALFLYFAIEFAALTVYKLLPLHNSLESPAATTIQAKVRTRREEVRAGNGGDSTGRSRRSTD